MKPVLETLDKNIERWALLVFYVMLVVTMAVEVIRREAFSYSSIWGEEIVRYSFIYLTWIGAAAAVHDRAHIRIDVILHYLSPRAKAFVYILGDLVMFVVAAIALYYAWETLSVSWKFGSVTDGLRISKVWFMMAVPLGFGLMMFRLVQSLIRDFKTLLGMTTLFEGNKMFD